jgi:hypothetical protein
MDVKPNLGECYLNQNEKSYYSYNYSYQPTRDLLSPKSQIQSPPFVRLAFGINFFPRDTQVRNSLTIGSLKLALTRTAEKDCSATSRVLRAPEPNICMGSRLEFAIKDTGDRIIVECQCFLMPI